MSKIIIIVFLLQCVSCRELNNEEKIKSNTISKVTVAFSGYGCESDCPFKALKIDSSLDMKYYMGTFNGSHGFYRGQTIQATWDSVKNRFEKFLKVGIDTTEFEKTDHPAVEFFITDNTGRSYFKRNTGKIKTEDLAILYWYIRLPLQTMNMKHSDSLTFETSLQNQIFH